MTKTKTGAKTKHSTKKGLTKANLAKTIKSAADKKVQPKEDTKYIYPDGCDTLKLRKEFRRKSRSSLSRYTKTLAKLKRSNKDADKKLYLQTEREYKKLQGAILQ